MPSHPRTVHCFGLDHVLRKIRGNILVSLSRLHKGRESYPAEYLLEPTNGNDRVGTVAAYAPRASRGSTLNRLLFKKSGRRLEM